MSRIELDVTVQRHLKTSDGRHFFTFPRLHLYALRAPLMSPSGVREGGGNNQLCCGHGSRIRLGRIRVADAGEASSLGQTRPGATCRPYDASREAAWDESHPIQRDGALEF